LALCEAEVTERDTKRVEHAIAAARFPFVKEIASYDFNGVENISKARLLDLAQGGYMVKAENILLLGSPGLGKTHLAIGLALAACRQAKRVRFYRAARLVDDLEIISKQFRR
jgi:DNA replication protein DnaC